MIQTTTPSSATSRMMSVRFQGCPGAISAIIQPFRSQQPLLRFVPLAARLRRGSIPLQRAAFVAPIDMKLSVRTRRQDRGHGLGLKRLGRLSPGQGVVNPP